MPGGSPLRKMLQFGEWLALAGGLVLVSLPAPGIPAAAITLLLVSFGLGAWGNRRLLPRTGLELPWLVFMLSAGIAAWISIAPELAWSQWSRILAAFVLFCAIVNAEGRIARSLAWMLLGGAALLAVSFCLTHPFNGDTGKFSLVTLVGRAINASFPALVGERMSANVTGGVLALAAPFGVALAWLGLREKRNLALATAVLLTLIVLAGLVMTSSRGALLGLVAAVCLALLGWAQVRWLPLPPGKVVFWLVLGSIGVLSLAGLAVGGNLDRLVGAVPDPNGSLQSRMSIWRQGVPLIGDYVFTGAGLATFPLVFSIYRLLIHVPYHEHMHNIFLETWYEQGILGALALVWGACIFAGWAWRALSPVEEDADEKKRWLRPLGFAGLAALAAMGVHGMVDVVFYLKASMPLVGLVLGMAWYASPGARRKLDSSIAALSRNDQTNSRLRFAGALLGGATLILLAGVYWRPLASAAYANLGSLVQTRTELALYDPDQFDAPLLDEIRQTAGLSAAESAFKKALELNPAQRTAIERLAEIELSRGQSAAALDRLQGITVNRKGDNVTQLLLSDALAAEGETELAAKAAEGAPWAAGRLLFQGFYRYWLREDYRRAANTWETALLLEPDNPDARYWLEQAQRHIVGE